MENELNEIIRQNVSKIESLEEELSHAIEDRNDYQQICQDQNNKIAGFKSKEKEM